MSTFTAEFTDADMARDEHRSQRSWVQQALAEGHTPASAGTIVQLSPDTTDPRTRYRVTGDVEPTPDPQERQMA